MKTQSELALMGCIERRRVDLEYQAIAGCNTEQAAMRLCVRWHKSRMNQDDIAKAIGIKPDVFSKMLNSDHYEDRGKACRYMSRTKQIALQAECGNNAIDQWADLYEKGQLYCQRDLEDQEAELLRQLAEIQARKSSTP